MNVESLNQIRDSMLASEDSARLDFQPVSFDTIIHLQERISTLPGDILEAGVWRGIMSVFMAKAFPDKTVWACDSFEGMPPLEHQKYKTPDGHYDWVVGDMAADTSFILANIEKYHARNIKIIKGFFDVTLSSLDISSLALLRLDCDSYSSTREVLEILYPKVVSGGYIIFDDFLIPASRAAMNEYFGCNDYIVYWPHAHVSVRACDIRAGESKAVGRGSYIIKE